MQTPDLWMLDLFSGVGMLGLAVEQMFSLVLGLDVAPVAYCEIAEYPRKVLAARMEDGTLKRAPILRDVTELPLPDLLGRVDLICAGFPCQPVSTPGKRLGQSDSRWLWPAVADALGALRPRYVFLENVAAITSLGGVDVIRDLARIGYAAEWGCLGSGDVGGSHGRERWWCLAYDPKQELANANGQRLQGRGVLPYASRDAWTDGEGGPPLDVHAWGPCDERWQDPPTSQDPPEPALCRVGDGMADGAHRIKAIGNGVDPMAAAVAFALLGERAGIWTLR